MADSVYKKYRKLRILKLSEPKSTVSIISAERRIDMRDDFERYLEEQLKDPAFRKEYEALELEYTIIACMIDVCTSKGLTHQNCPEQYK